MSEFIDYRKPALVKGAHVMDALVIPEAMMVGPDSTAWSFGGELCFLDGFAAFRFSAS